MLIDKKFSFAFILFSLYRGILYQNQQNFKNAVKSFKNALNFRPNLAGKKKKTEKLNNNNTNLQRSKKRKFI